MTLDEAIKHAEEVAKDNEQHCQLYPEQLAYTEKFYNAKKCGEEHRQLAEWLKDYKRLLSDARPKGEWRSEIISHQNWKGQVNNYYQPNSCSICHIGVADRTSFCPNCGADMRGDNNE